MTTKSTFLLSVAMMLATVTAASAATCSITHTHMAKMQHRTVTKSFGRDAFASTRALSTVGGSAIAIQDRFYRESN